jgi:hypothetical protein
MLGDVGRGMEDTNGLLRLEGTLIVPTEALSSPFIPPGTEPMTGLFSSSAKTYAAAETVVKLHG